MGSTAGLNEDAHYTRRGNTVANFEGCGGARTATETLGDIGRDPSRLSAHLALPDKRES
jgi:hypothetical protein